MSTKIAEMIERRRRSEQTLTKEAQKEVETGKGDHFFKWVFPKTPQAFDQKVEENRSKFYGNNAQK